MKLPVSDPRDSEPQDKATDWLVQTLLNSAQPDSLYCLDENGHLGLEALADKRLTGRLQVVSNRFDLAERALDLGLEARFNDFDLSIFPPASLNQVFYRISKEKPLVHHILNQAGRLLKPGGELILAGQKQEGIKTYIQKAGLYLGSNHTHADKQGPIYTARLIRSPQLGETLDTNDYNQPRAIGQWEGMTFYSKPGLFGWQKQDKGSNLLLAQLPPLIGTDRPRSLLDMGCGYGYLGLVAAKRLLTEPLKRCVFTDNNAAALAMTRYNLTQQQLNAEVIGADCGQGIEGQFDLILCNPPFHKGFRPDSRLIQTFLAQTRTKLAPGGRAVFVVNQFIPLKEAASRYFDHYQTLTRQAGFEVAMVG